MDFILSVKNAKLSVVNHKDYLITGNIRDLSLRVSYGKNILIIKNVLLTLTINNNKDNSDNLLVQSEYMYLNQKKTNNNLDYIGSILDNIFNQLTFKIYKISLKLSTLDISCRFKHVYLKPSTDNIYIKLKQINLLCQNPIKISLNFYKIKSFIVYNLNSISVKYINCLSVNIITNIKECLKNVGYLSNTNSSSNDCSKILEIFSNVNLNLDHLFINDTCINIGLQLNRLIINKDKIIIGLVRLIDKERVYIYVNNIKLIKYKYLIIQHINYHLNYTFIDYLREISYLISKQYPNNFSKFLEDNTSEIIISDTINIIDNYLEESGKTGSNNIPTIMNKSMRTIYNKKREPCNNIINLDDHYNTFDYVCDDYFQFVHINPASVLNIDSNIVFNLCCLVSKILIYDSNNSPITYIITNSIKYSLNKKNIWDFKLKDLKITDLTNSLWKNICYKISGDNFIKIKTTQYNNIPINTTDSSYFNLGNSYYIDIKVGKFAINLDELFLKTIYPVIENINEIFNDLNNVFSGKPLFIIQCLVSHINTVLSYKPRDLNIGNIINGNKQELIKLGTIRDMDINLSNFMVTNTFSLGELIQNIMINLERDLVTKGSIILGHVGILKQIFSPGLRATQVLNMQGNILDKATKYARYVSSDALELASRTSISIETAIETVIGKTNTNSKFKKRKLLENIDFCIFIKGITMSLLNLQHTIDPNQRDRNKMRYG